MNVTYGKLIMGVARGAAFGLVLAGIVYYKELDEVWRRYSQQFKRPLTKVEQEVKDLLEPSEG